MLDRPSAEELRAGIPWVDGHADVWRLFADARVLVVDDWFETGSQFRTHVRVRCLAMDPARVRLAVPDDPGLLDRLVAALARQGEPAIAVARARTAVLTFEAPTAELMLRSRVLQALEDVVGDDWQGLVEQVG